MSLLLLAAIFGSVLSLAMAVVFCLRGESDRARRIALRWSIGAASYAALLVIAAMLPHDSALRTGASYCDDDMCMSVRSVGETPVRNSISYRLAITLFSRANHGLRSATGASVYLTDDRGRRFPLVHDPSAIPFDVPVEPGKPVDTSLTFTTPSDARGLAVAVRMDRIQYASFIIGNGDLLHNPRLRLRIQ